MTKLYYNVSEFMDSVSDFYDIICKPCSEARISCYVKIIDKYIKNNDINILDFGCCTGETAIKLSEHNYYIEGIDISKRMVKIANEKAKIIRSSSKFFVADMRDINISKLYDVIYSNSLEWLQSYECLLNMIYSAASKLKENGIIILDFPNSKKFLKNYSKLSASTVTMKNNVYYKLTKFNDVEENIIDSSQTYIRINKDKGDIDTFSIDLVWRIHYLEEVIMLLKNAGFDVLETINEYNQKTFEDSLFIQVVGKKVNNLKTDQIKVKELKPELTQCRIIQIEKEKKEHNKDDNKKGEKNEKSKV